MRRLFWNAKEVRTVSSLPIVVIVSAENEIPGVPRMAPSFVIMWPTYVGDDEEGIEISSSRT